ncbi:Spy/CpxP family protein refolding chaperone [Algoriphagus sp. 4150]|uniref:hypothetical protein n=1 Tax=Algoriphagus sp. 4150 TaxID=2817756 RepID=UPI00285FFC18|nr:hypothetical protein [Algoriphagus sp. 4150]MDR7131479.1 Spy/CpxP family protein refolding chaperone [Algoriphagus sp. 4150]
MKTLVNKNLFTVLILIFTGFGTGALAQSNWSEEDKQALKERFEKYSEQLDLTEDQKTKTNGILEKYWKGIGTLSNSNAGKLQKFKEWKSLKEERDNAMKKVLDARQYALFEHFQKEIREEMKKRRGGGN